MGRRRVFSREFKTEAVRLVLERGVTVVQAAKDLGIHENVLGKWVRNFKTDSVQSFPGRGRMKPDDAEVARLRRELAKTKAERDILRNSRADLAIIGPPDTPVVGGAPSGWDVRMPRTA